MTCREFTGKIESFTLAELSRTADAEIFAHERACAACAALLQQRQSLAGALQFLRSSTAQMEAPAVVGQNVMRAFRQSAAQLPSTASSSLPQAFAFRLSRWFEWGAYAAAAAALAISLGVGAWYLTHRHTAAGDSAQQNSTTQPVIAEVQQKNTVQVPSQRPLQQSTPSTQPAARFATVSEKQSAAPVPMLAQAQQAQGYTPMMLCDPLSCSGDEQVVRMELPATEGSQERQMADVIIGDDGLVRAIRIVQQ